jgi:hypothetical protein
MRHFILFDADNCNQWNVAGKWLAHEAFPGSITYRRDDMLLSRYTHPGGMGNVYEVCGTEIKSLSQEMVDDLFPTRDSRRQSNDIKSLHLPTRDARLRSFLDISKGRTFVVVTATWCQPCMRLKRILKWDNVRGDNIYTSEKANAFCISLDTGDVLDTELIPEVRAFPTVFEVDRDGDLIKIGPEVLVSFKGWSAPLSQGLTR